MERLILWQVLQPIGDFKDGASRTERDRLDNSHGRSRHAALARQLDLDAVRISADLGVVNALSEIAQLVSVSQSDLLVGYVGVEEQVDQALAAIGVVAHELI